MTLVIQSIIDENWKARTSSTDTVRNARQRHRQRKRKIIVKWLFFSFGQDRNRNRSRSRSRSEPNFSTTSSSVHKSSLKSEKCCRRSPCSPWRLATRDWRLFRPANSRSGDSRTTRLSSAQPHSRALTESNNHCVPLKKHSNGPGGGAFCELGRAGLNARASERVLGIC